MIVRLPVTCVVFMMFLEIVNRLFLLLTFLASLTVVCVVPQMLLCVLLSETQ